MSSWERGEAMLTKDAMVEMPAEAFAGIDLALSLLRKQLDESLRSGATREGVADLLANLEAAERWWHLVGYNQAKIDGIPMPV
jgi:hypothetical protein